MGWRTRGEANSPRCLCWAVHVILFFVSLSSFLSLFLASPPDLGGFNYCNNKKNKETKMRYKKLKRDNFMYKENPGLLA